MIDSNATLINLNLVRKNSLERVNTLRLRSFIRESDALSEYYPEEPISIEAYGHYQALKHCITKGYEQELLTPEDFIDWCKLISEKEIIRDSTTSGKLAEFLEKFNESLVKMDFSTKEYLKISFMADSLWDFISKEAFSLGNERISRLLSCYLSAYLHYAIIIFYEREKPEIEEAFLTREALLKLIAKKITEIHIQADGKVLVKISERLPEVRYRGLDGSKLTIDLQELVTNVGAWS